MVLPALVEFRWGGECMGNEPNDLSQVGGEGGGGLGIRIYYRWSVANEGHDNILNRRAYNDPCSLVSGPAWKRKNQAAWWTNPFPPLLRALYAEPSSSSLLSFFFRLIFFSFLSISTPNETARGFMARTSFRNASNGPSLTTSWLLWSSIQLLLVTAVRRCSVLPIERCKDKNLPALLSRSNLKTTFAGMTGQSFFFFLLSMFLSIPFFFPPFYMTCWPGATADRLGLVMTSKQELRGGGGDH